VKLEKLENNVATVRFLVKDEGIGISDENQRTIFEPFSQADGSISRKYGGTGLGLAISLSIVKMLGSEIKLISREKEGSLFYFDLDLVVQDMMNIDSSKLKYDFAICNIIEDPEDIRNHLINTVKYFGRIHQGDEDIESCEKIDLIFCFGDPEFYEKLKRRKNRFQCPVVYVGNMEKINNNNIMKPLVNHFLDVPIFGSKVFNIIAESKLTEKHIEKIENKIVHRDTFSAKVLVAEDNPNNQLLIKIILQKLGLDVTIVENGQLAVESYEKEEFDLIFLDINMPVAEDNPNNQLLIKIILQKLGLDVTIVENGQLAVESYEKEEFDLIFLDINMPVMDGITALKLIREIEEKTGKHVPIIALTANSINGDRERYLDEGMDNYLSKPFDKEKLVSLLEEYLN
jgi:CheY-like chemotaxis protein